MLKPLPVLSPEQQLKNLGPFTYTIDCASCPFRDGCNTALAPIPVSAPNGIVQLMVISEQPSFEEETLGFAYGDRHSRYLKDLIAQIFSPYHTYYTYLSKCRTEKKLGKRNNQMCRETWLFKELDLFKPERILCLGRNTCKILGGKQGEFGNIYKNMGFWESASIILNSGRNYVTMFRGFLEKLKRVTI